MPSTYTDNAKICAKFYSLTLNSEETADFVFKKSRAVAGQNVLFVGGMFDIARDLKRRGLNITIVDYSDEMINVAKSVLPDIPSIRSDLRELPFRNQFDIVFVVGRVFTHMITEDDLQKAISGCKNSLKENGYLFADNYEDTRIQTTNYFNGQIECSDLTCKIVRDSTTSSLSDSPKIVKWDAHYSGDMDGMPFDFRDTMSHRAFSRQEFALELQKYGFQIQEQGDNFDETSFYTFAKIVG
ncbi:MAG TPA: class I SAM-dependent methyltransferase [Oligoflexia bacterium]|nr:class I SAM-dependent methyltransferase [Oligoflexia bacterium]HMP48707.1 class I SAM-dependent methyltransferase [Oligoflexia bacterium]